MLQSLDPIFSPRTVAVVGASRERKSIGWLIVDNLVQGQFAGTIYPVNPKASSIHSLKCYPSLAAIPDPVDLVVVVVPKPLVETVVDEGLALGVRGFVVITAGFGETSAEGKRIEERLRAKVRAAGGRLVGPNCMGVINADPELSLNATFSPTPATWGSVGFVSQSGALGVAILNVAESLGVGLTQFASMGNKADVSGNDLLEYWENDERTRVVAMYLESFGNPRRFTEIAKRIGRKKPILIVKSGRTAEGARAASSHTGALAAADLTINTFLEQCGVVRADTIEELFDIARAFDRSPLPAGRRVAIVTNAGGPGILATDACVHQGLRMAELAPATERALRLFLPATAAVSNPVDMIASAGVEEYRRALAATLDDPQVDAVLVINVTPLMSNPRDILEACGEVWRARGGEAAKPLLAVMMATEDFYDSLRGRTDLPPVYRFPEPAARALARLARYAEWRRRPEAEPVDYRFDFDAIGALLARADEEGQLPPAAGFGLLEAIGVPVVPWREVGGREEALAAAAALGYPVVAKAIAAGLVHKSELQAVALDLGDERELGTALDGLAARVRAAGLELSGFLVQKMASGGHETLFGLSTDDRWGPLVAFGLGGKYVEVFRDVRFGVPPLGPAEAREIVGSIRGVKLLEGVRGDAPADRELLADVLGRIAALAQRFPEILELDINPFLAAPVGGRSCALDVRVRVGSGS
ncbi:MAG TPA: acetate--CoA ligase family protein [Thermoanaerobaculia bacterium]|nr:acetate--CoA ligase family protein [Thermoanaerobaculia bacterium]